MGTIEKAIELAAREHAGDTDKAGAPYIFHPLRVMFSVSEPFERMSAVLHDVVEDTDITLDDLLAMGFPREVVDAVDALTKRDGESRMDAAARAAENNIALKVKLADLADNMDLGRLGDPSEKDRRRVEEYARVRQFLLDALESRNRVGGTGAPENER